MDKKYEKVRAFHPRLKKYMEGKVIDVKNYRNHNTQKMVVYSKLIHFDDNERAWVMNSQITKL